jgi:5-methyltetrahydrofolate--homocysteine methyltransferase
MNSFIQLLSNEKDVILLDGAMGTMLITQGLKPGTASELWNIDHPERVRSIHEEYIQAGAKVILTNSFGGNRIGLTKHGLLKQVGELNVAAAKVARQVADRSHLLVSIAGSIGPTGELLRPYGVLEFEEARDVFTEQISALVEGGVDVIWIESMSDLNEVRAAVEGARSVSDLPVVVTMSFDTKGHTMMGVNPSQAAKFYREAELTAAGSNCGKGPDDLLAVIKEMIQSGMEIPIVAKANAGVPKMIDNQIVYEGTPAIMSEYAANAKASGAKLIGACCGSTPDHIRSMAKALDIKIRN